MNVEKSVIGLDLGTKKAGICCLSNEIRPSSWSVSTLKVSKEEYVVEELKNIVDDATRISRVVIDAPVGQGNTVEGYRAIDRFFMRRDFNNNNVGLQPNNPNLLKIDTQELKGLLSEWEIEWSNDWNGDSQHSRLMRETFPNVVLGMLFEPDKIEEHRRKLRFQFGRGSNVPVVSAAFDLISKNKNKRASDFLSILNVSDTLDWEWLYGRHESNDKVSIETQGDDLIAALACALVGVYDLQGNAGYVRTRQDEQDDIVEGHYLLPGAEHLHPAWKQEIQKIYSEAEFRDYLSHNY